MNDIQHIITERVDNVPLLLEQMKRMELPTLIRPVYFLPMETGTGLSLGWVSTIWLSAIVSRGDHRLAHVEPWVAHRLVDPWKRRLTKMSSALISPMIGWK